MKTGPRCNLMKFKLDGTDTDLVASHFTGGIVDSSARQQFKLLLHVHQNRRGLHKVAASASHLDGIGTGRCTSGCGCAARPSATADARRRKGEEQQREQQRRAPPLARGNRQQEGAGHEHAAGAFREPIQAERAARRSERSRLTGLRIDHEYGLAGGSSTRQSGRGRFQGASRRIGEIQRAHSASEIHRSREA